MFNSGIAIVYLIISNILHVTLNLIFIYSVKMINYLLILVKYYMKDNMI